MPNILSPLRYPGGKAAFSRFLAEVILCNPTFKYYAEPYAGGAGAALALLKNGYVERIFLNDKNDFIYSFWKAVTMVPDAFIERIERTPVTFDEWTRQNELYKKINKHPSVKYRTRIIDKGFCTFFLNRCNRSGILGSGPIGGQDQKGEWKIDARFNKDDLISRLRTIKQLRRRIHVSREDAISFMRWFFQKNRSLSSGKILFYLDPPYYLKGKSLYRDHYYTDEDHMELSDFLSSFSEKWVLSYDDCEFIRTIYSNNSRQRAKRVNKISWAHYPKMGKEMIIGSKSCKLPRRKVRLSRKPLKEPK